MLHDFLAEPYASICIRSIVGDDPGTRPLAHGESVGDGGIVPHLAVSIGIGEINEFRYGLHGSVCRCRDGSLARRSTLGGDEDDSVGAAHSEHGCSRSVLKDGNAFDLIGVQLGERALDTIDKHQGVSTVERAGTADADLSIIGTRHTGLLDSRNAREITLEGICDIGDRSLQKVVTTYCRHCTGDGDFLLLAIRDDDSFVKGARVGLQGDGDTPSCNLNLQCLVSHA